MYFIEHAHSKDERNMKHHIALGLLVGTWMSY